MIELARHIEILLLSNDCVIVPNLGCFVASHIDACYDAEEYLFLPPLRTIGFNAQLKINDSLLAQSYTETYDISYPEALNRIEEEVNELRQRIENERTYELNGIGTLELNEEGNYVFSPCEAGILTPELYGLSTFEMKPLVDEQAETAKDDSEHAIIIKMSWIKNVAAVAVAVVSFFLFTSPISNSFSEGTSFNKAEFSMMTKEMPKANKKTIEQKALSLAIHRYDSIAKVKADSLQKTLAKQSSTDSVSQKPVAVKPQPIAQTEEKGFCIVLASQVARDNAESYVKRLKKDGFADARVYERNNMRRVVYGHFKTQNEAYNKLHALHGNSNFSDAWVYELK